ncbi:hypothetical protein NVV93_14575 [Pseudomonas sp. LS44]|uniref:hypothetical protein n=1 Tax=Pseudomonas sp. LS44 TaxID=1357074 RepID=UPI00215AF09B|nr:hypothetical protein [Pseudomonas sp. LS44]UVE16812.1 hypothetical protein NVV93_14575 [Pseudomonas sp. LS44]
MSTEQKRGITFLLPNGEQLQEDVPWQVASALLGVTCEQLADPIQVHEVRLLDDGFSLAVDDKDGLWQTILFVPRWFSRYRNTILSRQELEPKDSIEASNMLVLFVVASNDLVSRRTRKLIEAGLVDFDDVKNDLPEVLFHPEFMPFLVEKFSEGMAPANKSWKQPDPELGHELYELAVAIQVKAGKLSWNKAMAQAIEQRPDLVPASWRSDPADSLKKATQRSIEKSRFSLKGWRRPGDK